MGRNRKEPERKYYTRLKVIRPYKKDRHGNWLWECECNCGSGKAVRARLCDLRRGHVTSCGCLHTFACRKSERNAAMIADRRAGMKLADILKKYKITRQRVYQILKRDGRETQVPVVQDRDGQ
jgi:hypothetical protein